MKLIAALILFTCFNFSSFQQTPLSIGQKAPSIQDIAISGDTISLSALKGSVVLVDFWASWNTPSRRNNLTTQKIFEKYRALSLRKKRKFYIIQISLDTKPDLLSISISKDNLYWKTHLCDFKGWESPYVQHYQIRRIPANFLIDTAGNIAAKDVWETNLDKAIAKQMQ